MSSTMRGFQTPLPLPRSGWPSGRRGRADGWARAAAQSNPAALRIETEIRTLTANLGGTFYINGRPRARTGVIMSRTEDSMRLLALAAATLTLSLGWAADVQKTDVDIKAADGTNLKASYFSPGRPGPAMILLHQCNMDRHAWDGLANDLAAGGFHVLTFDFRGFGESGGSRPTDAAERRKTIQEKWPGDVDTAYAYLMA